MKYSMSHMWIDSFHLDPTKDATESGEQYSMLIECEVDYNEINNKQVRFAIDLKLHASKKFRFNACQKVLLSFEDEISQDEAEKVIQDLNTPSMLYPYVRAFTMATLHLAGHKNINLPVMYFK
ncbi:pretranslocase subunit SecB family protein [Enterobacteriaceae bacterium ATCC 29904]|nr:pretranslocase subunit SecB family protein [Enterobacteriaceae bacterium ATCC 29904]